MTLAYILITLYSALSAFIFWACIDDEHGIKDSSIIALTVPIQAPFRLAMYLIKKVK